MAKFSIELQRFFFEEADQRQAQITLADILELAGERTFGFLLVLLSLPSALPVPAPGYSIPFGILIFLLAIQMVAGRKRPWFPKFFMKRSVTLKHAQQFFKAGLPWLRRLEGLSRPRMSGICTSRTGEVAMGVAIALMAISMMIPLPLTNTFPAIGVFITGFSLIEDDGFIGISGLTVCAIALIVSTVIIGAYFYGGMSLVNAVIEQIRNLKPSGG
jgi:hypothetical protein